MPVRHGMAGLGYSGGEDAAFAARKVMTEACNGVDGLAAVRPLETGGEMMIKALARLSAIWHEYVTRLAAAVTPRQQQLRPVPVRVHRIQRWRRP